MRILKQKPCINCGKTILQKENCSEKAWTERVKFCCRACSSQYTWKSGRGKTQFIKGMVPPNKGKIYTEEQKKGMKLFEKGHTKVGTEYLRKWRNAGNEPWNKGKYGYHTHGGNKLTRTNKAIRQSQRYINWRNEIFKRDNWKCVWCGKHTKTLHADHIKQFALIVMEHNIKSVDESLLCNELWDINNGRTLCKSCHSKTDSYQKPLKIKKGKCGFL